MQHPMVSAERLPFLGEDVSGRPEAEQKAKDADQRLQVMDDLLKEAMVEKIERIEDGLR